MDIKRGEKRGAWVTISNSRCQAEDMAAATAELFFFFLFLSVPAANQTRGPKLNNAVFFFFAGGKKKRDLHTKAD